MESESYKIRCMIDGFFDRAVTKCTNQTESQSTYDQIKTEKAVEQCFSNFIGNTNKHDANTSYTDPCLAREKHVKYLLKGLSNLPSSFECLDSSRPWLCYWIVHALYLLNTELDESYANGIVDFLNRCQCENGGFGGGPGQSAHLATTYAAINTLCIIKSEYALSIIKRKELLGWIKRLKHKNGAIRMHEDGEEDLRGTYCAIVVAKLTNLEELDSTLFENVAEWVVLCQTYEGGFGASPGVEAHGGYTFCGVASLKLLGKDGLFDVDSLLYWLVNKQMKFEGGFQGRTNKLVDSCYSFWQGGQFPIVHSILAKNYKCIQESNAWLFNQHALQEYILICCNTAHGGFIDKPQKNRDFYHTCYALSGLSISQNFFNEITNISENEENIVNAIHPLFNISPSSVFFANEYFSKSSFAE